MTIRIPDTVFEGLVRWMARGPWPEHLQDVLHEHLHAYCDLHDIDDFEELADEIGAHWVAVLHDVAFNDFLSRETPDGNVVDLYLKRRGWKENAIGKAYMQGIRQSVISLYEVSDIRPGESFLARDLIRGGEPVRVEEHAGTKSMVPWEQFAMRIVEVRGHTMLAGGLLPFEAELSRQLIDEVTDLSDVAKIRLADMARVEGEALEPDALHAAALVLTLKISAPVFSCIWLAGTALNPGDAALPQLLNADGDEIEFVRLHYRFRKGATQAGIRAVLDPALDMQAASDRFWNWIGDGRKPLDGAIGRGRPGAVLVGSELEDGALVLGTLTMHGRTLLAETNSAERAERLKRRLDDLLEGLLQAPLTERQTVEQVMGGHRADPGRPEPAVLPPEEESRLMKAFFDRHYRDTLDQPIPMLDDRTPREAARSEAERGKVVSWLKYLEMHEARGRRGKQGEPYDFTWMWRELGVADQRE
ncbi:MAG: hypothetical protein RLO06_10825 [Parvibaculum sp.]